MQRLERLLNIHNIRYKIREKSIILDAFKSVRAAKEDMDLNNHVSIYDSNYWFQSVGVAVDTVIGERRKEFKIADGELLDSFIRKFSLEEGATTLFMDGSKVEGAKATGVSIAIENEDQAFTMSINEKCSIYTAEALAVEKTLGLIMEERSSKKDILILTDSKSICEAVRNNSLVANKQSLIIKIRERIERLSGKSKRRTTGDYRRKIVLGWIPSHAGILGNEVADTLAKEATKEEVDNRLKVPEQDLKIWLKKKV